MAGSPSAGSSRGSQTAVGLGHKGRPGRRRANAGCALLHPGRPYDPDQRLFGCRGELPAEGLPAITEIPVASFAALRAVSAMSREDHLVHLEGVPPSGWQVMPCERASHKELCDGREPLCRELPAASK